jgi:hypothetical protein
LLKRNNGDAMSLSTEDLATLADLVDEAARAYDICDCDNVDCMAMGALSDLAKLIESRLRRMTAPSSIVARIAQTHNMTTAEVVASRSANARRIRAKVYVHLRTQGRSLREIGEVFNIGPSTVKKVLDANGFPFKKRRVVVKGAFGTGARCEPR